MIPKGDWIIVRRAYNDTTTKGVVIKQGLKKEDALFNEKEDF